MKISIVCSSIDHPVHPYLQDWVQQHSCEHQIELVNQVKALAGGDLLLLVSCSEIVTQAIRDQYKASLVIHASDLPRGRGWSPHIWQVLEGKTSITVTLLEAEDRVDTGAIWSQETFDLEGHELYDEINQLLFEAELKLMDFALNTWNQVKPRLQHAEDVTYHRKRTPEDSEIDSNKPLADSFNVLRVADPDRFPAYFYHEGHKYTVKIEKAEQSMSKVITVDGRKIGSGYAPYVIAEMSANHNGDIDNAFKIIDAAKQAGSDAIKIQTYRPDTITLNCDKPDFQIEGGLWGGKTLYELYEWAHTPWEWHQPLFEYAKKVGITIFSSPFDSTAVDLLEELNAPAYKIASFEAIDIPLIKYVAATGKPMIISTGMANAQEIEEAIAAAREGGCKELAILHCVSGYPAPAQDYNLRTIPDMIQRFGLVTGLSDHTIDNTTAITSVALGASIIEKHVTLDRNGGGPDDSFSLEPHELAQLCSGAKTAWQSLGNIDYGRKSSEQGNVQFRRSLYVVKAIKAGETLTAENTKSIRPGMGLAPKHYEQVLGKTALADIEFGTPLSWNLIEQ